MQCPTSPFAVVFAADSRRWAALWVLLHCIKTQNLTYLQRLPQQNLLSFSRAVRKDSAGWNCLPVDWFQPLSMQDHTSPSDTPDAHFLQPDRYFLLYVHTFFISPAAHQSRWAMALLRYQHHHHTEGTRATATRLVCSLHIRIFNGIQSNWDEFSVNALVRCRGTPSQHTQFNLQPICLPHVTDGKTKNNYLD